MLILLRYSWEIMADQFAAPNFHNFQWWYQAPKLLTTLETGYCSMTCRFCAILRTVLISQPLISFSLNSLRSTWLASDLQQSPPWSKLNSWLQGLDTSIFCSGTQALVSWWNKCWCHVYITVGIKLLVWSICCFIFWNSFALEYCVVYIYICLFKNLFSVCIL